MAEQQYPIDAVTESAMVDGVEPKGLGMSLDDLVKGDKSAHRGGRGGGRGGGDRLKVRAGIRKNTGGGGGGRGGGFGGRGNAGPRKVRVHSRTEVEKIKIHFTCPTPIKQVLLGRRGGVKTLSNTAKKK